MRVNVIFWQNNYQYQSKLLKSSGTAEQGIIVAELLYTTGQRRRYLSNTRCCKSARGTSVHNQSLQPRKMNTTCSSTLNLQNSTILHQYVSYQPYELILYKLVIPLIILVGVPVMSCSFGLWYEYFLCIHRRLFIYLV